MTIIDTIGAIAFILVVALLAAIFDAMRGEDRQIIQPLIPSNKNPEIIGDGAWIEKPRSALVSKMPRIEA